MVALQDPVPDFLPQICSAGFPCDYGGYIRRGEGFPNEVEASRLAHTFGSLKGNERSSHCSAVSANGVPDWYRATASRCSSNVVEK